MVDDLVHMYGFKPLIVEDMIMRELPKKVQNVMAVQNTKALAQMLVVSLQTTMNIHGLFRGKFKLFQQC